jgi:hypothetical protein
MSWLDCPHCEIPFASRRGEYVHRWPEIWGFPPLVRKDAVWLECQECGGIVLLPGLVEAIETESRRLEALVYGV